MSRNRSTNSPVATHQYIDERIEEARKRWAWHFFTSQAIRLSLTLLAESIPGSPIGLILPFQSKKVPFLLEKVEDLPKLGPSVVGWLEKDGSSHILFAARPSFKYSSDYKVKQLGMVSRGDEHYLPVLVVQRKTNISHLPPNVIEIVKTLLSFVHAHREIWFPFFQQGLADSFIPVVNVHNGTLPHDDLLNSLADIIIQLGNFARPEQSNWRFCCILRPEEARLPIQLQDLVVYAQSKAAPHKVGITTVFADREPPCLSIRAYQGGYMHVVDVLSPDDITVEFLDIEGPVGSVLAFPISKNYEGVQALLYIVSDTPNAFSSVDQIILRLIGKMLERLLAGYAEIQKTAQGLLEVVKQPHVIDTTFAHFAFETHFRRDVRHVLDSILNNQQPGSWPREISFIAAAVDKANDIAHHYGNEITRNLYSEIGSRIEYYSRAQFTEASIYYIYNDKFYVLLPNIALDDAQHHASHLKKSFLDGSYDVPQQSHVGNGLPLKQRVHIEHITVRLAVASYSHAEIVELVEHHKKDVNLVSARIIDMLAKTLKMGEEQGGNKIITLSHLHQRLMS